MTVARPPLCTGALLGLRPNAMAWMRRHKAGCGTRRRTLAGEEAERATLRRDLQSGVTDPVEAETADLAHRAL
jgi:hypothetical protein